MRHASLLSDQEPFVSWHDASIVYVIAAGFSLGVILFAGIGIFVAGKHADFGRHAWVAWMLLVLGSVVLMASLGRLGWRIYLAFEKYRDKGPGIPL
jgi:hypothetical protein